MNISTKTSTEVTETTIKEVSTELNINKKHVKTHVKLDLGGKTILDEDGHSILANFGRYMEFLMCGTTPIAKPSYTLSRMGVVSRSTGGKLVVTFPTTQYLGTGSDPKTISLYVPDYPNIHLIPIGITTVSTSSPFPVTCDFDISSTDYDGLIGRSVNCCAYYTDGFKLIGLPNVNGIYRDILELLVGVNDAVVTIDDREFYNVPSDLLTPSETSVTITSDTSTDETYLTASCSYTNSTDAPIVIREIGLKANGLSYSINYVYNYNTSGEYMYHGLKLLIARDVIDEVTIPVGRTLNVTYTIMSKIAKSTGAEGANTDSGFTNNFLTGVGSVLASQLSASIIKESGSSSSLPTNPTSSYSDWLFCGSSIPSCKNRFISTRAKLGNELDTWRPGVLLCSGPNDTQDVTNYIPGLEIPNGTGTGELEYLMSWGEEGTLDSTSYSFTLKRLVRNSSGADIEVKALALISNQYSATMGAMVIGDGMLLAQTNLDPPDFITIPNGKMCIVSYTIKVEI